MKQEQTTKPISGLDEQLERLLQLWQKAESSPCRVCDAMSIPKLIEYLELGWILYDVSNKSEEDKIGIKYLVLANPNQKE